MRLVQFRISKHPIHSYIAVLGPFGQDQSSYLHIHLLLFLLLLLLLNCLEELLDLCALERGLLLLLGSGLCEAFSLGTLIS